MTNLTPLEQQVIAMLLQGDDDVLAVLRQQVLVATASSREMTGVGFYTDLGVPSDAERVAGRPNFKLTGVDGSAANVRHGLGFVLFIADGALATLEGFTYDEPWPEQIQDLMLTRRANARQRADLPDEKRLRRSLDGLPRNRLLGFMLLLCERMKPAFDTFAGDTGVDDTPYRKCLDNAWSYLSGGKLASDHDALTQACLECAPDTEAFDHPLTSAALNFALSVHSLMAFSSDDNVDHVVEAAGLSRDTVSFEAQRIAAVEPLSLSYEALMRHPLMQQELQRQDEDLTFVASLSTDDPAEMVSLVRARNAQADRS